MNEKSIFILNTPLTHRKPTCWGDFAPVNIITPDQGEGGGGGWKNKWGGSQTWSNPRNQSPRSRETLVNSSPGVPFLKCGRLRHVKSLRTAAAELMQNKVPCKRQEWRIRLECTTISWQPRPADGALAHGPRLPATAWELGTRNPTPPPPPPHSPPRRSVLFRGLRYKVDFLFRSFIFSWERFWAPRKNRLLSSPSCFILHLLRGLLRILWHFSARDEGDWNWTNARCSSAH